MTDTTPLAGQELRERIRDILNAGGGSQQVIAVVQPELDRLEAELANARADGMREGAALLRRHCPEHGYLDTVGMTCHCDGADQITAAVSVQSA